MSSDQHNWIMAKATGLILSLFNFTLAEEVPFAIPLKTKLYGFRLITGVRGTTI